MNILIVTAHPSQFGDTHKIANTYASIKKANGNEVKIVDLYHKDYYIPYMSFERIREMPLSDIQKKFHEQIQWANEVVVVHPVWWSMPPSIMKNWVELTIWPRIAYKYTPTGSVEKLFEGKTAKVFATCGGQSWWYYFYFLPLLSFWKIAVFHFCGIELIDFKVCGKLDILKDDKREAALQKFLKKITQSAQRIK